MSHAIVSAARVALAGLVTPIVPTAEPGKRFTWVGQTRGAKPDLDAYVTVLRVFGIATVSGLQDGGIATAGPTRYWREELEIVSNYPAPEPCDLEGVLRLIEADQIAQLQALSPVSGAPSPIDNLHVGYAPCRVEEVIGAEGNRVALRSAVPVITEFYA